MRYLLRFLQIFLTFTFILAITIGTIGGATYAAHMVGDYVFAHTDSAAEAGLSAVATIVMALTALASMMAAIITD